MKNVGLVGWRGMVGSVLINRMKEENDFSLHNYYFFTTSQAGQKAPVFTDNQNDTLLDAFDLNELKKMDVILTCQGGDYTSKVHTSLRKTGWSGYWVDAASTLRMKDHAIISLDPVNLSVIQQGVKSGVKDFVGGNCTVSLMLMALDGLFKEDLIEWVSSMTYQAASGAGARHMKELISQMGFLANSAGDLLQDKAQILELDSVISNSFTNHKFPNNNFGYPLAGSLLPWIDTEVEEGRSREEWKGMVETNKILQKSLPIPIDGTCVRMGAMRCHSQAMTIKLKSSIPLDEINDICANANEWVSVVPNNKESTLESLTPASVTGTLDIPIGRIRKMNLGENYLNAFTVGDQLLWGAAEPLRRLLTILFN